MSGKKGFSRAANACGEILTYPQVLPDGVFWGTEYGLPDEDKPDQKGIRFPNHRQGKSG